MNSELAKSILDVVGDGPDGATTAKVCKLLRKSAQELGSLFELLLKEERIHGFAGLWFTPEGLEAGAAAFVEQLRLSQQAAPGDVARSAGLKWSGKPLDRIVSRLVESGRIEKHGELICAPGFLPDLSAKQRAFLDRVLQALEEEPVNTPTPHEIAKLLQVPIQAVEEALRLALRRKEVVQLADVVFYTPRQLANVRQRLEQIKEFDTKELRDALRSTRKYVLPLQEYFDSIGFTKKTGDRRSVILEQR